MGREWTVVEVAGRPGIYSCEAMHEDGDKFLVVFEEPETSKKNAEGFAAHWSTQEGAVTDD